LSLEAAGDDRPKKLENMSSLVLVPPLFHPCSEVVQDEIRLLLLLCLLLTCGMEVGLMMPDDRVVVVRASAASLLLCRLKTATRTEIRDSGGVSPIILLLCQQVLRYSLEDYYCYFGCWIF
jgi:hypothetical protein